MDVIRNNKSIILTIVGILLVVVLGVSYAYYAVGDKQEQANILTSGCLSISITDESASVNLTNAIPMTLEEGLNTTPYTFSITNNCDTSAPYEVNLESINEQSNTLGAPYVQVSLEDSEGRRTTSKLGDLSVANRTIENSYDARNIFNGEIAGGAKTNFKLRLWLDYDATVEQAANKVFQSKIVVNAKNSGTVDNAKVHLAFSEVSHEEGGNGWYKSYATRASITGEDSSYTAKYCVAVSNCEPNTDIAVEGGQATFNYPSGANILCMRASDSKGNSSNITCNDLIKVDGNKPTVVFGTESMTTTSITVNVTGTDNESGIREYYYKIGDGAYTNKTTSSHTFSGLTQGTTYNVSVYVVDNAGNTSEVINKDITTKVSASGTIIAGDNPKPGTDSFTGIATADDTGLFSTTDDDGTTYYYRGINASVNNWVDFAGFKWRIIRINGDGSIRMIYNGTSTATTGTGTQLSSEAAFNSGYDDNAYVGYMYGTAGSSTYAATHANTNSSTIKGVLDNWYKTNIVDKNYDKYVSKEAGFCGDRQLSSGGGYGMSDTDYASYGRLSSSPQTPTYSCNTNDLYTVASSSKGNKALTYPVGLITSDEVVYAGGFRGTANSSYWLYTNKTYFTMSPYYTYSMNSHAWAVVYLVCTAGDLGTDYGEVLSYARGVRPVINLSSEVTLTGSGTTSAPFRIASE